MGKGIARRLLVVCATTLAIMLVAAGVSDATPLQLDPALDMQGQV